MKCKVRNSEDASESFLRLYQELACDYFILKNTGKFLQDYVKNIIFFKTRLLSVIFDP